MNKYLKTFLTSLVLVLVMVGASYGYKALSKKYKEDKQDSTTQAVTTEEEKKSEEADTEEEQETSEDAAATEDADESDSKDEEVQTVPDFKFLNSDGKEVHLSDYFDKPLVLNFWATWCGPCQMEMPYFDAAYKVYGDRINFVMVDLTDGARDTVESAKAFIEEQGYSFPIGFDTEYEGSYNYGVSSIPMTFFIEKGGVPKVYTIGSIEEDVLNEQLDELVGQ